MRLLYTSRSGTTWDVSALAKSFTWSGDYQQAARVLTLSMVWSDKDPDYPRQVIGNIDNGEVFRLFNELGDELFRGYVFSFSKTLGATERIYKIYDGLIYFLKSSISQNFSKITAQGVTRQVAAEMGIPIGTMVSDAGISLSFAHIAKNAYQAIMGAWTHVSTASGKKYLPRMVEGKLCILEMGATVADRVLTASSDILQGEVSSSIEDAITKVLIVDSKGKTLATTSDAETLTQYGLLQASVEKQDGMDAKAQAKDLLKGADNQMALSDILGGPDALDLVTGNAALVQEPSTGLNGLFYIINDTHTFSNGQHHISLGLSFEAMMDTAEVELIKEKKKVSKKSTPPPVQANPWAAWEKYGTSSNSALNARTIGQVILLEQ